ncbi:MAG TPA: glycosyltransferase [Pyrinomonadaceae bacterium]|jgi:glycosyltransferase involved in cell wall biosynthesis
MKLSIVIPAFNEEKYLPATLKKVYQALAVAKCDAEVIVVDNQSLDKTGEIAKNSGAVVVFEIEHNIGKVRNTGAKTAEGDLLVFVDADTQAPQKLFQRIVEIMADEKCFGGAVAVEYENFERKWMRFYLLGWHFWSAFLNMKQGATQFCRKDAFLEIGGYDESVYMGEDVEFYWRLSKLARQNGGYLHFIENPKVVTSSRRFDKMNVWKILLLTNPLFFLFTTKKKSLWRDWYDKPIR